MQIFNKRAKYEYEITPEKVEAGVSLKGIEAKSLRDGRGDLSQSHVRIMENEVYLINANIPANSPNYNPTRIRKLLLHRKEIISIRTKIKQQKLVLVPLKLYNKGRLIKLELALGKPKRKFEKKDAIKKRDIEMDIKRELRGDKDR